jgi:5-methylcytosine-specific restriction endonuclease McrA
MSLRHLPTLAQVEATRAFRPQPKGAARVVDKTQAQRAQKQADAAFRAAVWKRDKSTCQHCGCKVERTLTLTAKRGEVHHLRGRRVAPEDRTNPAKALLLCAEDHVLAQQHKIVVRAPRR